ncbi:hypothetical protein N2W54_007002 [Lotmaria passim]
MQVLRAQAQRLHCRGMPSGSSCYRALRLNFACKDASFYLLNDQREAACQLSILQSCRHASSVSEAADKQAKESSSAADGTASGGGGAASHKPSLDAEAMEAKRQAARDAIIQEIISRDKVIFELKRQHELSMLRVEQNQARVLKDQEDRGMYYEQNSNVHTFDTISVGLYSQRSTLYHTMSAERLRNLKIFLMVFTTFATCAYFYYRYIINPDWEYVERPMKMIGSRVQAVREQRWKLLSNDQKFDEMRKQDKEFASQHE